MFAKSALTILSLATACYLEALAQVPTGSAGDTIHVTPGRRLKQLQATMAINPADPVSATTADLTNDPTGRGHLLVRAVYIYACACAFSRPKEPALRPVPHQRFCVVMLLSQLELVMSDDVQALLSNAASYVEEYTYMQSSFPPDVFSVPWTIDPTAALGLSGTHRKYGGDLSVTLLKPIAGKLVWLRPNLTVWSLVLVDAEAALRMRRRRSEIRGSIIGPPEDPRPA